ncbi:MAG: DUF4838 domain-containing protein [Clostridiales bacterium]|nr:DUF4838 domain-containing protein [Clostridiales bacterium]
MIKRRGIVIHAADCGDYWAGRLENSGLNVVGVHPAGGMDAHRSLEDCIRFLGTPEWRRFAARMEKAGIAVEFEMHALSWLLERDRFETNPDWFRMDASGERTPLFNCCASNSEALEHIRERAAELARIFRPDTHHYHFWIDDVASAGCACPACRSLSASDQAMILYRAIADGVCSVDPAARVSYLAYCETLKLPETVQPDDRLFLEFAPIARDFEHSLFDPTCEKNAAQVSTLPALLELFGRRDAKALDYWVDNSLFSGWQLPPKAFTLNAEICRADVAAYRALGFEAVTSFGCFLGENYRDLWGDADLDPYFRILRED